MSEFGGRPSIASLSERGRSESNRELRAILLGHVTNESRDILLDVGGGTGLLTDTISDIFTQVLVLEPDLGKVEYGAVRRPGVGFIRGSAENIPISSGVVGTLVSVAAFHHFPNQEAALQEMRRVLKPGGKLLLLEVDISRMQGKLLRFIENTLMRHGSNFLRSEELQREVELHGFTDTTLNHTSRGYGIVATRGSETTRET